MANTRVTPTNVTRKALQILHQKLNFVGNINRQYDDSYKGGDAVVRGKFGPTLKIRNPNEYVVRSGLSMDVKEDVEVTQDLTVSTVKGVDLNFSSTELALELDDFAARILEPAMSVLAANIENDALSMYKDVYNLIDGDTVAFGFDPVANANTMLTNMLAPTSGRSMLMNTTHANKFIKDTKSLFNSSENIDKQYRDGIVGKTGGFKMYENTLLVPHTTGTAPKSTLQTVNGAITANGAVGVVLAGTTGTWKKGDVFTVVGCNRVHPETKQDTGVAQQFVVTTDSTGVAGVTLAFTPAIYTTGGRQNVVAAGMPHGAALVKPGAGAGETLNQSIAFHENAFTFVTADLPMPDGVDWAKREVFDGISMSMVRDFTISDRSFPCRLDVLYGYKAIRPQLATRVHNDG